MGQVSKRKSNASKWRDRVERAARHQGELREFCRAEGISLATLRYWQRKPAVAGPATSSDLIPTTARSPFLGVEVFADVGSQPTRLPDARWVADLIVHLQRGVVR